MLKTIYAALALLALMIGTAVFVSQTGQTDARDAQSGQSTAIRVSRTDDGSAAPLRTNGSGGVENNPFVIALGLTAILCLAFGFWNYHKIHEDRRLEQEAVVATAQKNTRFKYGGRKEEHV